MSQFKICHPGLVVHLCSRKHTGYFDKIFSLAAMPYAAITLFRIGGVFHKNYIRLAIVKNCGVFSVTYLWRIWFHIGFKLWPTEGYVWCLMRCCGVTVSSAQRFILTVM